MTPFQRAVTGLLLCVLLAACADSPLVATPAPPTPTATPTAVPTKPPVPTRTPLPTIPPDPTSTPRPVIPTPAWTPIPAVVANWLVYQGKSGFSLSYPSGWYIREDLGSASPAGSAVTLIIVNYDPATIPPKTFTIPGAMGVQLLDFQGTFPTGGIPFDVGPQKLPGTLIQNDYSNPIDQSHGLQRTIEIYFTAGNRQWVISGNFFPPQEGVSNYTDIFYHILGSLRYDAK